MDLQSGCLPMDVMERVLSFLPIPTICKMRVVCKEWKEFTNNATFHALCDKNGKKEDYLFLWRKDNFLATGHKNISPRFGETFHFFDLDLERWYSIPTTQVNRACVGNPNEEMVQRFIGMDNGLVWEALCFYNRELHGRKLNFSIMDPIVKSNMELPSPILFYPPPSADDPDPSLVTVVDHVTHSYKVFCFNPMTNMPLAHVLESSTKTWRVVGGLPRPMDDTIAFRNTVIASLSKGGDFLDFPDFQLRLFRYEVEGNTFAKVWEINFQRTVQYSKLLVCHNRLFVLVITRCRTVRHILLSLVNSRELQVEEGCFQTCKHEKGALFEMYEVLLDEGCIKPIVQFTEDALHAIWGDDVCSNYWFAFPCFDPNGRYSSVVLMKHHSGEMRRFHLGTRVVDVLPACPLITTIADMENVISTFDAKTMPLNLRDVLKHAPSTM